MGFPYSTAPVPPFGVPQVLSWSFWGGVWGVGAGGAPARPRLPDLLFGFVFGALVLTVVGFTRSPR